MNSVSVRCSRNTLSCFCGSLDADNLQYKDNLVRVLVVITETGRSDSHCLLLSCVNLVIRILVRAFQNLHGIFLHFVAKHRQTVYSLESVLSTSTQGF